MANDLHHLLVGIRKIHKELCRKWILIFQAVTMPVSINSDIIFARFMGRENRLCVKPLSSLSIWRQYISRIFYKKDMCGGTDSILCISSLLKTQVHNSGDSALISNYSECMQYPHSWMSCKELKHAMTSYCQISQTYLLDFRSRAVANLRTSMSEFLADLCSDSLCSSSLLWGTSGVWFNTKQFVYSNCNGAASSADHGTWERGCSCVRQSQQSVSPHKAILDQVRWLPLKRAVPREVNSMDHLSWATASLPRSVLLLLSDSLRACSPVCRKAWGGSQGYNYHSVQCCGACFPSVQQWMWAWWCNKRVQKVKSC